MRILHAIDSIDPALGGPVEAIRQFAAAAGHEGHHVEVVTLDGDISQWRSSWAVPVHAVPGAHTSYRYSRGFGKWLAKNRTRFDVVVVHGLWKFQTVGVWLALRRTSTPFFVIPHGMLNPWLKQAYPKKHLKKALLWHALVHRALRASAAVLFLCEEEPVLAAQTFKLEKCRKEIVPLGIVEPRAAPDRPGEFLAQYPELDGRPYLLFLGRICRMKGCDLLLEAFARAASPDHENLLVIAGPDEDGWQAELKRRAADLGIEHRVLWTGPLYGDRKAEALRNASGFILPSHCETFPVAVLEALAYGKPVLITDKINIWREIDRGHAGIIAPDTLAGVEEMLRTWFALSSPERAKYGANAISCFRIHFEIAAATRAHVIMYRKYLPGGQDAAGDLTEVPICES
jgi:glycosyltransferase involved in cell wall biosynthesis